MYLASIFPVLFIIFLIIAVLVLIFIVSFFNEKSHKNILIKRKPSRFLTKKDVKAMQFMHVKGSLAQVSLKKESKNIWQFTNCSFRIKSDYRSDYKSRILVSFFDLKVNDDIIEVYIPKVFLSYIKKMITLKTKPLK